MIHNSHNCRQDVAVDMRLLSSETNDYVLIVSDVMGKGVIFKADYKSQHSCLMIRRKNKHCPELVAFKAVNIYQLANQQVSSAYA